MSFLLFSASFSEGSRIPQRFTGEGENLSPQLQWNGAPSRTQGYTLIMEDPDAPSGTFMHWILFNIPSATTSLPEGIARKLNIPGIGQHGLNSFRKAEYDGPFPPPGKPHRYYFKLFALDRILDLPSGCSSSQVYKALQGHIVDSCQLMGLYER